MSTAEYQAAYRVDMDRGLRRLVDATGTRRRLQALSAIGWSIPRLERACGLRRWRLDDALTKPRIARGPAELVTHIYDDYWDKPPVCLTTGERTGRARALSTARRNRWAPPMAWDDDTIDLPAGVAAGQGKSPLHRKWTETLEEVEHFKAFGYSDERIAQRLGIRADTLYQVRRRAA